MLKLVSNNLWPMLSRKAAAARSKHAAIAYMTDTALLPLGSGDILVTDASDAAIAGGRTSASALAKYFGLGVDLYSLENLHAKALVLDDWAVVGSANASQNSASYFVEAAVVTDRPELVGQVEKLISLLATIATPIDKTFIERISAIPVARPVGFPPGAEPKRTVSLTEQRFWFLGIQEKRYPGDADRVEDEKDKLEVSLSKTAGAVDWFWWHTSTRFAQTANVGDIVIECWRPQSALRSTKAVKVYRHARIAKIVHEEGVNAKAFLCIWPSDSETSALTWTSFLSLAKRAGVRRRLTPNSAVELTERQSSALYELWGS